MLTHHEAVVNGVRLHYVEAGDGPLVVLLHGFPEFWYGWRSQIPALAAAGFRVLAPDMRGYNHSEKPPGVRAYRMELLAEDVAGLVRHAGVRQASLVGHDWGGSVAVAAAMRRSEMVARIALLNAPHPAAYARALRTPAQLARSWYVFALQPPWLPEALIRARDYRLLRRVFERDPMRPDSFTPEDIERYVEAFRRPGALTAAINYYRAALRQLPRWRKKRYGRRIDIPVLVIWGERDRYLGVALTRGLERWMPHVRVERIADASHWVQHDARERVNELLTDFLRD